MTGAEVPPQPLAVEGYYRWQSRIYDGTRWSFLFGRTAVIEQLARLAQPKQILEVGCGTGRNLAELARRFPQARLTGVDVSADMLAITRRKLRGRAELRRQRYDAPVAAGAHDLVLCSYALSMFNPGWEAALDAAAADLAPGGLLALVDFHGSRHAWFRRWMGLNHVRMDGHLLPALEGRFDTVISTRRPAYGGVWEWLLHVGRKPPGY